MHYKHKLLSFLIKMLKKFTLILGYLVFSMFWVLLVEHKSQEDLMLKNIITSYEAYKEEEPHELLYEEEDDDNEINHT